MENCPLSKLTAESYIQQKGWTTKEHGNEIWLNCPACGEGLKDGSFSINAVAGTWNCKRGTCRGFGGQTSGTLYQLMQALGDAKEYSKPGAKGLVRPAVEKKYEAPKPLVADTSLVDEARTYIQSRGLDIETVRLFGVKPVVHPEGRAIAFPYFRNGQHVHTKYRLRDGKKEAWKNFKADPGCKRTLYGADMIPATSGSLIITEGEFDAIAMKCLGMPAVSMPDGISSIDGWIEEEYEWLQRFKTIFLAVDMDVKEADLKKLANRLGIERCKRVVMPLKDANECLLAGWGAEDLQKALNEAEDIRPQELRHSEDFCDDYANSRFVQDSEEKNLGPKWHIPGLAVMLKGKRPGNLTIWPGFNGAGKTTLMLQEMGDDCAAGVKCLFFCLEMSAFEATDWLLQQQCRKPMKEVTVGDYQKAVFAGFLQNLWWVEPRGALRDEQLIEAARYAVLRYGVTQIYIDNLTCLWFRKDDMNAIAEFAKTCKFKLARELGAHVHLIVHTRKAQNMKVVSADRNDIAGPKELSDLADEVIITRRNEEKDPVKSRGKATTWLDVDKNRHDRALGIISLQYNMKTNRMDRFEANGNYRADFDGPGF